METVVVKPRLLLMFRKIKSQSMGQRGTYLSNDRAKAELSLEPHGAQKLHGFQAPWDGSHGTLDWMSTHSQAPFLRWGVLGHFFLK